MLMTWWMGCGWNMCQKFKYLECVLDESGIYSTEWCKKVVSRRKVVGTIRSLVNARNLQLECGRVLHEVMLMPILLFSSETMI